MGVVAVLRKKSVSPLKLPMKRSRSPSLSASAKAGLAVNPSLEIPKGLVSAAAKARSLLPGAAVLRKKRVLPALLPIKRSRSPSPSASAKAGVAEKPTSVIPKGLVTAEANSGSVLPGAAMLRKKKVSPLFATLLPMKRSRSPSPSASAKAGLALMTMGIPKGVSPPSCMNAGVSAEPVLRKKKVFPKVSPMKRSRSPSRSMSANSGLAIKPTVVIPKGLVAAAA